jgi:hypothetical protein
MADHWKGFKVLTYEINDSVLQDCLSDEGYIKLLCNVLKVRRTGIVVLAPVCSSFCWLNRSTSGRTLIDPLGDERVKSVKDGNLMVSRVVLLLWLLKARGCVFVVEQPMGSILPEHPRFVDFLKKFPGTWKVFWLLLFGHQCCSECEPRVQHM